MSLEIGAIYEGKVTGITKFGAFVSLPERKSGLVHISEIADAFVKDIADFVQMGQMVKVKLLSITEDGKINLSIKQAPQAEPAAAKEEAPRPVQRTAPRRPEPVAPVQEEVAPPSDDKSFEDKLKKFMQDSGSRIADNPLYADHRQRRRSR